MSMDSTGTFTRQVLSGLISAWALSSHHLTHKNDVVHSFSWQCPCFELFG